MSILQYYIFLEKNGAITNVTRAKPGRTVTIIQRENAETIGAEQVYSTLEAFTSRIKQTPAIAFSKDGQTLHDKYSERKKKWANQKTLLTYIHSSRGAYKIDSGCTLLKPTEVT